MILLVFAAIQTFLREISGVSLGNMEAAAIIFSRTARSTDAN